MFSLFRKKYHLVESGWLHGMTDIHSHLVPGVDDGVKTVAESEEVLRMMKQIGIRKVITTPHIFSRYPQNNALSLRIAFNKLQKQLLRGADLPEIGLAAEYMVDADYSKQLSEFPLLKVGASNYLLVEFSFAGSPMGYNQLLFKVNEVGAIPLLAHPERFLYFSEEDYSRLKNQGCLFQLNLFSLTGMYGEAVAKRAKQLLLEDWYDFVGTDTHNPHAFSRCIQNALLPASMEAPIRNLVERGSVF